MKVILKRNSLGFRRHNVVEFLEVQKSKISDIPGGQISQDSQKQVVVLCLACFFVCLFL